MTYVNKNKDSELLCFLLSTGLLYPLIPSFSNGGHYFELNPLNLYPILNTKKFRKQHKPI